MKLSVNVFVSLDGVMQGPGGSDEDRSGGFDRGGWAVPLFDPETFQVVDGWFHRAEAFLLGRTSYEMMRVYWSQVTDPENFVATSLNGGQKYVVSNTLTDADAAWGTTTVIRGTDIVEQISALKQQPGGELQVHGSWQLVQFLHDAGLVDRYCIMQMPVVVGSGKRLFAEGAAPTTFELASSLVTSSGSSCLELRPRERGTRSGEFIVVDGAEAVAP